MELYNIKTYKGENLKDFTLKYSTDLACKEHLANVKWANGYTCKKCNHTKSQIRKDFSRTCNICSYTESATANTLFHKIKFGLRKAFFICYKMCATLNSISASQVSIRYDIQISTARNFMNKVRNAMNSSQNFEILNRLNLKTDKINLYKKGNKAKTNVVGLIKNNITKEDKLTVFSINRKNITTLTEEAKEQNHLKWLSKDLYLVENLDKINFELKPLLSNSEKNSNKIYKKLEDAKLWIKKTYKNIKPLNIVKYLDEYLFQINRDKNKNKVEIFEELIYLMLITKN